MSAHLAKNKIFIQLEEDGYIGNKVIEKDSQDDDGLEGIKEELLKHQAEDIMTCLNTTTSKTSYSI